LGEFPGESVLTAAAAQYEDAHSLK
jgi:hypothetical protein